MFKTLDQASKRELIRMVEEARDFELFIMEAIGQDAYNNIIKAWLKDKCGRESPTIYKSLYGEEYKGTES